MKVDLLVAGAGPAGLTAAAAAAEHGLDVMVVDEHPHPGGQLRGQLHEVPGRGWVRGHEEAERIAARARAAGVRVVHGTAVWTLEPGWNVHVRGRELAGRVVAPQVVLATGAAERPAVVPGWTLPGVMTVGAAQVLANVHRVRPGGRAVVAGVNVLALSIARELALAGVQVLGIGLPPPGALNGARAVPEQVILGMARLARLAPSPILRLGGAVGRSPAGARLGARFYPARGFSVWGIPIWLRQAIVNIEGSEQVEAVQLQAVSPSGKLLPGGRRLEVDLVCVSAGLYPLVELAAAAGCRMAHVPSLGGTVPLVDAHLRTTAPGLYAAGSITGIEGAGVAEAQGTLAGLAVVADSGRLAPTEAAHRLAQAAAGVAAARARAPIQFDPGTAAGRAEVLRLMQSDPSREEDARVPGGTHSGD